VETQSIVVLDFGAQYSQLIARRVREQNVFSAVLPCNSKIEDIRKYSPVGIILSGGPSSVYDHDAPPADPRIFELSLPVLGICYGLQFMAHALGGKVRAAERREYGHAQVELLEDSELFKGLPRTLEVWMSHGDEALELPSGFKLIAKSPNAVAGIEDARRRLFAVQFHPEVGGEQLVLWLDAGGREMVEQEGQDPDQLVAETIAQEPAARDRADALVTSALRIAGRAGSPQRVICAATGIDA